jgi:hypothetical protein
MHKGKSAAVGSVVSPGRIRDRNQDLKIHAVNSTFEAYNLRATIS